MKTEKAKPLKVKK